MGFLDRLFGKKPTAPADNGIYFYVRCNHCERVLHTRLNPQSDLSENEDGFEVQKEMMDDRCFRRLTLSATFDRQRRVQRAEVTGGTLIPREVWEAEKNLPRRPAPPPAEP